MSNGNIGDSCAADLLRGRLTLLTPVYLTTRAFPGDTPAQDHNDGTWWLIETHVSTMFSGHYKAPADSKMPKIDQHNVTAAFIIGNEDAPEEIWMSIAPLVRFNSKFWRVA